MKTPTSNWLVGKSVGIYLVNVWYGKAHYTVDGVVFHCMYIKAS